MEEEPVPHDKAVLLKELLSVLIVPTGAPLPRHVRIN